MLYIITFNKDVTAATTDATPPRLDMTSDAATIVNATIAIVGADYLAPSNTGSKISDISLI
ncbi:hypothetical protein KPL33_13010 [Clostridium algidicarnis]|uniref:hypothetical protein n=1 Tax=Clostridium algidicarnis TaxID=37659 RepID=UPI001C0B6521|nr:hypothetical protein [Clostridium algidicarnis]MBU3207882.1 hypothetical protein [Clostridium algidicarnis]